MTHITGPRPREVARICKAFRAAMMAMDGTVSESAVAVYALVRDMAKRLGATRGELHIFDDYHEGFPP